MARGELLSQAFDVEGQVDIVSIIQAVRMISLTHLFTPGVMVHKIYLREPLDIIVLQELYNNKLLLILAQLPPLV